MKGINERFWSKVDKSGDCWMWTAYTTFFGYGQFRFIDKNVGAHRMAYMLERGEIPDSLCVLHKCDVPGCVNPDHLFLGTKSENAADRHRKGRTAKGMKAGNSKLTDSGIRDIRRRIAVGEQQNKIAVAFGVHPTLINQIKKGKVWTHIVA